MKKTYVKPAMAVEMFTLTQTVASCGIGGATTHSNKESCAYNAGFAMIWTVGTVAACTSNASDFDSETICYDLPDGKSGVFSS